MLYLNAFLYSAVYFGAFMFNLMDLERWHRFLDIFKIIDGLLFYVLQLLHDHVYFFLVYYWR